MKTDQELLRAVIDAQVCEMAFLRSLVEVVRRGGCTASIERRIVEASEVRRRARQAWLYRVQEKQLFEVPVRPHRTLSEVLDSLEVSP